MKKKFVILVLTIALIFTGMIQAIAQNEDVDGARLAQGAEMNDDTLKISGITEEKTTEQINDNNGLQSSREVTEINDTSADELQGNLAGEKVTTERNSMRKAPMEADKKVVKIGSTEYKSLKEAVQEAKEGDTITVIVPELRLTEYINIPGTKKLTLDLNNNKIIFAKDDPYRHSVNISQGGSFTIKNGTMTAEDVNKDGKTSPGISADNTDFYIENVEACNMKSNATGSALRISNDKHDPIVKITRSNFHDNEASRCGGAIYISNSNVGGFNGNYNISHCTFMKNIVVDESKSYGVAYGGAICISTTGTIVIEGNTISENEARATHKYNSWVDYSWSSGGGMYLGSNVNANAKANVTLEGNTISKNKAQLFGGGVYLELTKSAPKNDEIHLNSGLFSENYSAYAGGGLDYSAHNQPILKMENVIIRGNKSHSGGGIWACPTSRVRSHSTLGATIIENQLITDKDKVYPLSGTDVRFEGSDTKIPGILDYNKPDYNKMTVQDRTFLGNKVNWYADDPDNLYKSGNPILTPDKYTGRNTSFGLFGEIVAGSDWYEKHQKEAKVIFIGNVAEKRGGAISTNSDIDLGQPNDVDVKVTKKWLDKDGSELKENLPKFVEVKLIRKDSKGGSYDLETVKLNPKNNWTHKFEKLPSKGYVDGNLLDFSYEVVEINTPDGFKCNVNSVKPTDNVKYEYVIENKKEDIHKIDIPVKKFWKDENNKLGTRPDSITVSLFADGKDTGKTIELTKDQNWEGKFIGLYEEKYGKSIEYSVREKEVAGYKTNVSGNQKDGFIIRNTYKPSKPPKTGDGSNIKLKLMITLIFLSIIYIIVRKNRHLSA